MNKYIKPITYTFISILIISIILCLLNYFNILNGKAFTISKTLGTLLSVMYGSYTIGKTSMCKGYKYGFYYSLITILILLVFKLLFGIKLSIKLLLGYLTIIIISIISSTIGINRKKS